MRKAQIELEPDSITIDGMRVTFEVIPQFLYELAHPDPRKWFNFERIGDAAIVHMEMRPKSDIPRKCPNCGYLTENAYTYCPYDGILLDAAPEYVVKQGEVM